MKKIACMLSAILPAALLSLGNAFAQCPASPTVNDGATFTPFATLERLEVRSGRPGTQDWEWGLGLNTQQAGQFTQAYLNWVNNIAYAFTLTYDGAGNGTYSVADGGTVLFTKTWTGGLDAGNALKFYVKSSANIGVGNLVTARITSIDGTAVDATIATAGNNLFSEQSVYFAGNSLSDGFTAQGTVTMTFTGSYPPLGSRLNFMVTAGNVTCPQAQQSQYYYVHADHLNTPRVITDQNQQVVWKWDNTEPFGANIANGDVDGDGQIVTCNLRFPGQYFDAETGNHYNYFRDYSPEIGRYVESDPIGLRGGPNTYLYVDGVPADTIDPTGLIKCIYNPPNMNTTNCELVNKHTSDRDLYQWRNSGSIIFQTLNVPKPQFSISLSSPNRQLPVTQPPIGPSVKVEQYWEVQFGYDVETRFRQNMLNVEEEWKCSGSGGCQTAGSTQKRTITCFDDWIATKTTKRSMPWVRGYLKQVK